MKKNSKNYSQCFRKNLLVLSMRALVFSSATVAFGMSPNVPLNVTTPNIQQQQQPIKGLVTDATGIPIPGATIFEKGTSNGIISNFDGIFTITPLKADAILVVTYVGFKTQEIKITNQTTLNITLEEDVSTLDEVVIVGYGTQKKPNLTAAVSVVEAETFENRPVSNAAQALQGAAPGLQISNTALGGEPGATPDINIRGLVTSSADGDIGNSGPLILIDGVEMGLNEIDPEDIETVSVLKDAAAAAIYGATAAGGAILVTTKSGKNMNGGVKVSYSYNYSLSQPTVWPSSVDAYTFALVANEASANAGGSALYSDEALGWIQQNMEEPGSAPTMVVNAAGNDWDTHSAGIGASGSTDWKDFLFDDVAPRTKHNLSIRGGDQKLNYYLSAGAYSEDGLLTIGDEFYNRYNFDAKISAKPYKWLKIDLMSKCMKSEDDFPWDADYGRGRVFDLLSKIKPTLPTVDPIYGEPLLAAYYPRWATNRENNKKNQVVLLPRVTIEPIKDWTINLQYNYRRNNNKRVYSSTKYEYTLPNGVATSFPTQDLTSYNPTLYTNEYFSPNLFTSYKKSIKGHNFDVLLGYQSQLYESYNLFATASTLLSDDVPSVSTTVGERTVEDSIDSWATQSIFGRFNYNYKEKYLFSVTYRNDGTSKFAPGERKLGFPSFTAGYNMAKENFWPIKDISTFKLRGSYGNLGNQNVTSNLYSPPINTGQGTYLMNGSWNYVATAPSIASQNLTWEQVETTDFGFDVTAFKNKLNFTFDWYRSDVFDMASTGAALPAVLGTDEPRVNEGAMRVQGWESEITWKDNIGDFKYDIKAVLSDYKRTTLEYPNETGTLSSYNTGTDTGDIWGLKWVGWFQSQEDIDTYAIDQSALSGYSWKPGDTKYEDVNGDGEITIGQNTLDDHGDKVVVGNTTPRYQYSFRLGMEYKGFDFNMFIQGVGKKDINLAAHQRFLGPAQHSYHMNVYEGHLDYWRDESSALGANPDAFFAKPYSQRDANNAKNYNYSVNRYIQSAAYTRLKSLQIGYNVPKKVLNKIGLNKLRIYATGENLLTFTDLMFYDPETSSDRTFGSAISYPLSKIYSFGLNITL